MDFIFGLILFFIFGLLIGSFLNCWSWRLYQGEKVSGRSYCPRCRHLIRWYDNIPVISFLLLKGRCRDCHQKISWQYPLVELLTAGLFAASWAAFSANPWFVAKSLVVISLLLLVLIFDWRWYLIPTSVLAWGALVVAFLGYFAYAGTLGEYLVALLVVTASGALFFLIQYLLTQGRGLGEGDIWLGAFLGLSFANLPNLAAALMLSYFLGALVSLILMLAKQKKWGSRLPLGVFLALGGISAWFLAERLVTWYLGLF